MPVSRVRFTSVVEAVRSARGSFTVMLTVSRLCSLRSSWRRCGTRFVSDSPRACR